MIYSNVLQKGKSFLYAFKRSTKVQEKSQSYFWKEWPTLPCSEELCMCLVLMRNMEYQIQNFQLYCLLLLNNITIHHCVMTV